MYRPRESWNIEVIPGACVEIRTAFDGEGLVELRPGHGTGGAHVNRSQTAETMVQGEFSGKV